MELAPLTNPLLALPPLHFCPHDYHSCMATLDSFVVLTFGGRFVLHCAIKSKLFYLVLKDKGNT
jgi:hypothetical protein